MYCPNCGKQITENDNFCPNCGFNLKKESTEINKNLEYEDLYSTKVFKPIKDIDSIDSTDEIKDIIKAVDDKISKNITQHEEKIKENTSKHKPIKTDTSNPKISLDEKEISSKKSIKQMWKDFINEDNDDFSLFSNMAKNSSEKINDSNKDYINKEVESIIVNNNYKEPSSYKDLTAIVNSELNKSQTATTIVKDETTKEHEVFSKIDNINIASELNHTDNIKSDYNMQQINNEGESSKKKFNFSNFKEKFSKPSFDFSKIKSSIKTKIPNRESKKNTEDNFSIINENKEKIVNIDNLKIEKDFIPTSKWKIKIYEYFDKYYTKLIPYLTKILNDEKNLYILAGLAAILSSLPIFIAGRKFSAMIILLVIIKLLFKIFQFYLPLKVTTDRSWLEEDRKTIISYAIITWGICEAILFIAFILSPWNGMFNFSILSALTPLPIATVILVLLALSISLLFYWKYLRNESKVDFIAWYIIPFLLIELLSKLLFMITNIII